MRADIAGYLRCPLCANPLTPDGAALRCLLGHSFDVARQGYVNLLTGRNPSIGDTPEMMAARARVLDAGHFAVVSAAIAEAARECAYGSGLVVDVGAGTGHYLAELLDRRPDRVGLALDVAKPAVKRAARAHPRAGAVLCDTWHGLPLADGCADLVLNVFAPRNGPEFHRILRPDGTLVVVTPRADHLRELVETLGLLGVDPAKEHRLTASLGRWFHPARQHTATRRLDLSHADALALAAMGPSAWHTDPARLAARLAELPEPIPVTISIRVSASTPR